MTKAHTEVVVDYLPNCDFCHRENKETPASYDGKTILGPWANMCQKHFEQYGIGLGLGKGQRLIKKVPHELVKGEQTGMLGVPGKVHTQKRPYEAGQMEFESYTKYKEATRKVLQYYMPSESDLHWRTVAELKQMCSQRGLPTDGKKEDLIRRLEKAKLIWKDVF